MNKQIKNSDSISNDNKPSLNNKNRGYEDVIIHTEPMPQIWKKVNFKNKMKLRAAYPAGVLSVAIIKDLVKHKWLNLAFVGVSLIPGPGGILFFPGLLLSYSIRRDEHAKNTRRRLLNLFKHDVPLAKYHQIIKPVSEEKNQYYVDTKALAKHNFGIIKNGAIRIKNTALKNFPEVYDRFISSPFNKACNWMGLGLSKVIGKKGSKATIQAIFNTKSKVEHTAHRVVMWVDKTSEDVGSWASRSFLNLFNNASQQNKPVAKKKFTPSEADKKNKKLSNLSP